MNLEYIPPGFGGPSWLDGFEDPVIVAKCPSDTNVGATHEPDPDAWWPRGKCHQWGRLRIIERDSPQMPLGVTRGCRKCAGTVAADTVREIPCPTCGTLVETPKLSNHLVSCDGGSSEVSHAD